MSSQRSIIIFLILAIIGTGIALGVVLSRDDKSSPSVDSVPAQADSVAEIDEAAEESEARSDNSNRVADDGDGTPVEPVEPTPTPEPLPTSTSAPTAQPTATPRATPTSEPPPVPTPTTLSRLSVPRRATFRGEGVNVRSSPSLAAPVCFLKSDRYSGIDVLSAVTDDGWYRVETPFNQCGKSTGWMFGAFLEPVDGGFAVAESVRGYTAALFITGPDGTSIRNPTAGAVLLVDPKSTESSWTVQLPDGRLGRVDANLVEVVN